jgi:hypothetical protein
MNRHTKLALMVAPFLILGGFIASDFYMEHEADKLKIITLAPVGGCDVLNKKCILKSNEFEVSVYDENGITTVNSTFPLDTATFFTVDENDVPTVYPLGMKDSPYYWKNHTDLRNLVSNKGDKYKLRLVASIKGGQYIAEFHTQTSQ